MPGDLIEGEARRCWEEARRVVREGVELTVRTGRDGRLRVGNNLPKQSQNRVAHVRPHARRAYYVLGDGTVIGDDPRDGSVLPDGRVMTRQSFWFNSSFVRDVVSGRDA